MLLQSPPRLRPQRGQKYRGVIARGELAGADVDPEPAVEAPGPDGVEAGAVGDVADVLVPVLVGADKVVVEYAPVAEGELRPEVAV